MPKDTRALVAVDLGAESCRVSLLRWVDGVPQHTLVHRIANGPVQREDGLHWPLEQIVQGMEEGLRKAAELVPEGIRSIAVDGWAVDYVRLDRKGEPLAEPFCYRDPRNEAAERALHAKLSPLRMREITGIQQMPLNTLYQLYADKLAGLPPQRWLNLPEYLLARWGAEPVAEFTNATHTQLVETHSHQWSREIFRDAGLSIECAPRIVPPGTLLGKLHGPLASLSAYADTELIAPACHDTASAIAGIAAGGDDWAYISSGTWSLVGALTLEAVNGPTARAENFTNLGGVGGTNCFHKNVNGMWLLKQCQDAWAQQGYTPHIAELLAAAEREPAPAVLLDVDDPDLMRMGEMPRRINRQLAARGAATLPETPESAAPLTSLILHSLAARYAQVLRVVAEETGKDLRRVFIVGGGCQNQLLNRLTAQATGMQVCCGSPESSTLGNFAVQFATLEGEASASSLAFRDEVYHWASRLA
ncbi:rhamnulokinase [Terriglobus aquaticus]|uniref:rhamnulokinase n=1 Tax=Terriglobus aquaticus TaxID=940139 RepID=UPI0031DCE010